MFIRWKRRPAGVQGRRWRGRSDEQLLAAVLARSERVNGQPRQRVVAYLGSIRESHVSPSLIAASRLRDEACWYLLRFWRGVDTKLVASVADADERDRLAAQVAAIVPRLSDVVRADYEAAQQERVWLVGASRV